MSSKQNEEEIVHFLHDMTKYSKLEQELYIIMFCFGSHLLEVLYKGNVNNTFLVVTMETSANS